MTASNGQRLAAIYARVSTEEQKEKGYSLPTQIQACLKLAQQEGYTVPDGHIFQDDYTGTSLNRPQLRTMRDLAQQGVVQAVIVYDMDRLSRKLAHQLLLSEELEQCGAPWGIHTSSMRTKVPITRFTRKKPSWCGESFGCTSKTGCHR